MNRNKNLFAGHEFKMGQQLRPCFTHQGIGTLSPFASHIILGFYFSLKVLPLPRDPQMQGVVSTVVSGILFACFPTVDYVTQLQLSLFMTSSLFQKSSSRDRIFGKGKSVKIKEKKVKKKQSLSLTHCAVVSNTHKVPVFSLCKYTLQQKVVTFCYMYIEK